MPRQRSAPDLYDADPFGGQFEGGGALGALGRLVSAHPSLAGGTVAFTVIFGFIASNALWSQPGRHPAPILKTRDVAGPAARALTEAPAAPALDVTAPMFGDVPVRTVTTFRIERSDETPTASIPVPNPTPVTLSSPVSRPNARPETVASAPAPAPEVAAQPQPLPKADPVLVQMQEILARKGLYSGEIDGLMGPKSAAAIRAWEKANGYVQTGEASPGLLAVMQTPVQVPERAPVQTQQPPAEAPVPAVETVSLDEVPAPKSRPEPVTVPATGTGASSAAAPEPAAILPEAGELVRKIQSGLSNIAYADITVDGVAGAQTKNAIRAFEKHYRLPVTGEPNQAVLDKLLEIGAL
ncbi:MAG: peptidoglycan-binding domain-containing protein [Hoeflea sp.]|uniref:peptidoglycan-binding domain-containing protein n=1 Tax=Hoeflea sp. TaxID=1940281 RepID=UPI0032EE66CE